ncbi:MAG: glycerol-3-phosphate dehydrogenase subunit GlpB [Bacteroidales bacterium]|nr:glycerol-3-phosphate dehydrogenase subunit GlpB [Bacteroidales bacterium]
MKFDTIIIGGGLSGMTAGITLARAGQRVAIFSTGQSALQFSSGSMELLGQLDGEPVERPTEAFDSLPESHPYRRIGKAKWLDLLGHVQPMLSEAGINTIGDTSRNRWRLTPLGKIKPAWLTLDDFATFTSPDKLPWRSVALVNITDFIDFYPRFLAPTLERRGVKCRQESVTIPRLEKLRRSSTEMRAPTVARLLDDDAIRQIAGRLNVIARDVDALIMPAVVGLRDDHQLTLLRRLIVKPVYFVTTMSASVPGIRIQMQLDAYFKKLGGMLFPGDTVVKANMDGDKIRAVYTVNHGDEPLEADNYMLASGSFFGNGLVALPDRIIEPVLGLDVEAPGLRAEWYKPDLYDAQPFMAFGVKSDESFRPSLDSRTISNLYAVGSILGGCNPIKEGCGAGVAILTAMFAADKILE